MTSNTEKQQTRQTLSISYWIRLVLTYLLIPLILLLCGGDVGWWQAWVYSLLVFSAGILGRLWAERRHPGLLAERLAFENATGVKSWDKVHCPADGRQCRLSTGGRGRP